MLLPQPVPVGGWVEAYNERSLHIKYRSQGVMTSFCESTPTAHDPKGNTKSPGAQRGTGNVRADIPDASEECDNRVASRFTMVFTQTYS